MKKVCLILAVILAALCIPSASFADDAGIVIYSSEISKTGRVSVYGAITGTEATEAELTILLIEGDLNTSAEYLRTSGDLASHIAYIGQQSIGNNMAFLWDFLIPEKFMDGTLTVAMGSDAGAGTRFEIEAPELGADLDFVANGSVIYGLDAYFISSDSQYLNAETVTASIINGGNNIFYKFGGNWFDLTDPDATDSSYMLDSGNIVPAADMQELDMRYYYRLTDRLEF